MLTHIYIHIYTHAHTHKLTHTYIYTHSYMPQVSSTCTRTQYKVALLLQTVGFLYNYGPQTVTGCCVTTLILNHDIPKA